MIITLKSQSVVGNITGGLISLSGLGTIIRTIIKGTKPSHKNNIKDD